MAQRLWHGRRQAFETKTEKSETGGKDVVLVAVSSLSKQARNAWKEREKLKSFTEEFPGGAGSTSRSPEVPWYVNADVDWYIENYKERVLQGCGAWKRDQESFFSMTKETGQSTLKSLHRSILGRSREHSTDILRHTLKHPHGRTSFRRKPEPDMSSSRFCACAGSLKSTGCLPEHQAGGQTGYQEYMVQ